MRTTVIMNEKQKEKIEAASKACGLSASSFFKLAAIEKMNRMGIQIQTSNEAKKE